MKVVLFLSCELLQALRTLNEQIIDDIPEWEIDVTRPGEMDCSFLHDTPSEHDSSECVEIYFYRHDTKRRPMLHTKNILSDVLWMVGDRHDWEDVDEITGQEYVDSLFHCKRSKIDGRERDGTRFSITFRFLHCNLEVDIDRNDDETPKQSLVVSKLDLAGVHCHEKRNLRKDRIRLSRAHNDISSKIIYEYHWSKHEHFKMLHLSCSVLTLFVDGPVVFDELSGKFWTNDAHWSLLSFSLETTVNSMPKIDMVEP